MFMRLLNSMTTNHVFAKFVLFLVTLFNITVTIMSKGILAIPSLILEKYAYTIYCVVTDTKISENTRTMFSALGLFAGLTTVIVAANSGSFFMWLCGWVLFLNSLNETTFMYKTKFKDAAI